MEPSTCELPDHTGIQLEKIPYIRLRFDSLQLAQEILQRLENDVTAIWNIAYYKFSMIKLGSKSAQVI
ncbi:hypothetical protein HN873_050957 [Arachis hypogaea]